MVPKLSVIVCTFNRSGRLKKCLASLTKQNFSDFEVIIVDGGSTDNTNKVIFEYRQQLKIKKVVEKRKELSIVRDVGWREAKGEYVSWIDDDIVVSKNWADVIVKILDNNKEVGGITGPTLIKKSFLQNRDVFVFYNKGGLVGFLAKLWERFFLEGNKFEVGKILKCGAWTPGSNFKNCLKLTGLVDVDYLEACNMTLRRRLVKKAGGFDYGYKKVAEWCELDLAMRVKELGYRLVFSSKAITYHNISQGGAYSRRTNAKERMENFFKFYFRHIFKPRLDYLFKFLTYLLFLSTYWGYKAISTKNINWLGGWAGTITGLKYVGKSGQVKNSTK